MDSGWQIPDNGATNMKKVLLLIGGGYHPFEIFRKIYTPFLEDDAGYEVEATEDRNVLKALDSYDAIVIYTQGGALTGEQEKGLLDFVKAGGGCVGIHSASDSFKENEGYMEMIGSEFIGHGAMADITVEHTDDYEQIIPRVEKTWTIFDEFYQLRIRAKEPLRAFQYGTWEFEKKMTGYVRDYGKGKVMYTGLGHGEEALSHPEFKDMIAKAIRYVSGEKETALRWGIVGYGPLYGMGAHHVGNLERTSGMDLAAVCDTDPARIEAAKEAHGDGIQYFLDSKDLIESGSCDGVTVILPHNLHAPVTLPILKAGLHAISEKPFAITPDECDRMIQAARDSGAVLSVYHNRHWDEDIVTLRGIVESGAIGEVFSIEHNMCGYNRPGQSWRAHKPISGGLLYDMGAHGFEKALQLVPTFDPWNVEPRNRKAVLFGNFMKKVWWDTTSEDYCRAYVKFDSGLEVLLTQSNISSADRPGWIVSGTKGSCVSTDDGFELKQFENGALRSTIVPYVTEVNWHYFYRNFADHIHAGAPLIITPGLAKATIQCIHGCELAAQEGKLITAEFNYN